MDCPYCQSKLFTQLKRTTSWGYTIFRCQSCRRNYNERTDTTFNRIEVPTDIVFEVLLCRIRYKLSYRDVSEYFLFRGFEFSHETVRDWEERFLPLFTDQIRAKRKGKAGKIWKVDETYVRVKGEWCYLYRGIDENGNLVDVRLSKTRDMDGTKAFFARAIEIGENIPERVQTDGLASYPRAIEEELGKEVKHKVLPCTANEIEQSHRGIKHRYYPMMGFGEFDAAQRFCQAFDEVRHFLRPRSRMGEVVSLSERREQFQNKVSELKEIFLATS
jgi:transposase-like protein